MDMLLIIAVCSYTVHALFRAHQGWPPPLHKDTQKLTSTTCSSNVCCKGTNHHISTTLAQLAAQPLHIYSILTYSHFRDTKANTTRPNSHIEK